MAEKLEYYTQKNHPKTQGQDLHIEYFTKYIEVINDEGEYYLEPYETVNQFEITQKYKDECSIENVLKASAVGDLSMLNQREGTYIDATGLPKTLAESQNLVIRMKREFEDMPSEVKKLFNNSPEKYVNMMGTKEFNDIMAPYNKKISDIRDAGSLVEYNKKVAAQAKFNKDVKAAEGSES